MTRIVKRVVDRVVVEYTIDGVSQLDNKIEILGWPLFLQPLKLLAKPEDKGLGDIIERTIGPIGGDAYKAWYEATFGKPCRCTKREDQLNERYPL